MNDLLKFSRANAKLRALETLTGARVDTFSLPAGRTCPGASECKAMAAVDRDGKRYRIDGPDQEYTCFAANDEVTYRQTYEARLHNLKLLRKARSADRIADLIIASIPKRAEIIRWHVSGDFFSRAYLDGMFRAFERMPDRRAYFYTKSIPFLVQLADRKPDNVSVTASIGGKFDALAGEHGIRSVRVYGEHVPKGVTIDHDDRHALAPNRGKLGGQSFGLQIHGIQRPGNWGSGELVKLRRKGVKTGYSRDRKVA